MHTQPSKDCVQKTLKRLEEKVAGKVLNQVLYSLTAPDRILQQRTATALARLVKEADLKLVFVDRRALDILLHMLTDPASSQAQHREAAGGAQMSEQGSHHHCGCSDSGRVSSCLRAYSDLAGLPCRPSLIPDCCCTSMHAPACLRCQIWAA